jgi:hypothetical protein
VLGEVGHGEAAFGGRGAPIHQGHRGHYRTK